MIIWIERLYLHNDARLLTNVSKMYLDSKSDSSEYLVGSNVISQPGKDLKRSN